MEIYLLIQSFSNIHAILLYSVNIFLHYYQQLYLSLMLSNLKDNQEYGYEHQNIIINYLLTLFL